MTQFVIRDVMTDTYYRGSNPRVPQMGGTKKEATRFVDRMAAASALAQFPLQVLAEVQEVVG